MANRGHSKHLLTVAELIAQLQQMPQDHLVYLEGTEADAEATGVQLDMPGTVIITGEAFHAQRWTPKTNG